MDYHKGGLILWGISFASLGVYLTGWFGICGSQTLGFFCRYAHNDSEMTQITQAAERKKVLTHEQVRPLEVPGSAFAKSGPYSH